jgi:hypothetical protein
MRFVIWTIILVCSSLLPRSANADAITVTAGSGGFDGPLSIHEGIGTAQMIAPDLFLKSFLDAPLNFPCQIAGSGCMAGDRVNLSFPAGFDNFFSGRDDSFVNGLPVNFARGELEFIAHGLTTVRTDRVVRTPFSLGGHVAGYDAFGTVITQADLLGTGLMFASFGSHADRGDAIFLTDLSFDFASPTPEPSTLLTFGAVAAALCGTRRKWLGMGARE